jgi:lipopolysaccharide export system permease protein
MRLLARYLLRECLVALAYCFSAFLILWVTLDLMSSLHDMQENKLHAGDVVEFYLFRLPEFLPIALPDALLLALLYALTNHARYNEITAIRAAGVSLSRLCLPYLSIACVAGALLFCSNEFIAPKTADIAEQILFRRVQKQRPEAEQEQVKNLFFHTLRNGQDRFWRIGVYDQKTGEMQQPFVEWRLPDGSRRSIFAERAAYTNGVWTFYQVRELKQITATNSLLARLPETNSISVPEFSETPEEIKSEISVSDRYGHQTRTHRADIPISEITNYLRLHPNPPPGIRSWLYTKLYGRFAEPFTCIVVVLLAVPFAAGSGRRNVFVGVAASIVIFFVYYLLQQLGFAFGEAGRIPAWFGAWFPNLLFGGAGLWMMARVR